MIDEMLRYDAKERALTLNSCALLAFLIGKLRDTARLRLKARDNEDTDIRARCQAVR